MNGKLKRICTMLLISLLVFGTASFSYADDEPDSAGGFEVSTESDDFSNTVNSEEELDAWLGKNIPGTVVLGKSITITKNIHVNFDPSVTIDTGAFSLIFEKAFAKNATLGQITGEGVDSPVVVLKDTAVMFGGDWNNRLRLLNITATGKDGAGGTALRVSAQNIGSLETVSMFFEEPGKIRSSGAGAIGIELTVPFDLYGFDVEVTGAGSAAIYADKGGSAHFCRLSASAGGEAVKSGVDGFIMHNCAASPAVAQKGITVTRAEFSDNPIYYPVEKNSPLNDILSDIYRFHLNVPFRETSANSKVNSIYVEWDMDTLSGIDMGKTGSTEVTGELIGPPMLSEWFSSLLTLTRPARMIIDVRDPDIPCISNVNFILNNSGIPVAQLVMWTLKSDELWEQCVLWRSGDGGKTWSDCAADPKVAWFNGPGTPPMNIEVELSVIPEGTMFQVELPGVGESNIIVISYKEGKPSVGQGGDRTGTDRIIGAITSDGKPASDLGRDSGNSANKNRNRHINSNNSNNSNININISTNSGGTPASVYENSETSFPVEITGMNEIALSDGDKETGIIDNSNKLHTAQNGTDTTAVLVTSAPAAPVTYTPVAQPDLPEPGAGSNAVPAAAASVALLCAGGYFLLGRGKLFKKP